MLKGLTVLAAAAAVLVALPASAETAKKKHTAKHKAHVVRIAREAAPAHRGANLFPVGPLYYNGDVYMGDDPDPFIRSQLWRDVSGRFGGGDN
jgi:hypothetical protein